MQKINIAQGVSISPSLPSTGKPVTVEYSGILAQKSGLTLCVAYGTGPDKFTSQEDFIMHKEQNKWSARFEVNENTDTINFAFKDAQGNFDNNNGQYYRSPVDTDNMSYA